MKKIAVIMGSDSDMPVVEKAIGVLERFGVPYEVHVCSAHRTPAEAAECLCRIIEDGFVPEKVFDERMKSFFFDFDGNCAENLYRYVVEQDKMLRK